MSDDLLSDDLVASVRRIFRFSLDELMAKALWDKGIRRSDLIKMSLHSEYPFTNIYNHLDNWEKSFFPHGKLPDAIKL